MPPLSSNWIVVAHLLRPQGRKGEILSELHTDFVERFEEHPAIYLAPPNFSGGPAEATQTQVTSFWLPVGKNAGRIVLHLAGVNSITEAEALCGKDVLIPAEQRYALEEDANYIGDLIDCKLFDSGTFVGLIEDVQFPMSPDGNSRLPEAAPLLVVRSPEGDEILIPYAKDFLLSVAADEKRIEMKLPEGLVDVNR